MNNHSEIQKNVEELANKAMDMHENLVAAVLFMLSGVLLLDSPEVEKAFSEVVYQFGIELKKHLKNIDPNQGSYFVNKN